MGYPYIHTRSLADTHRFGGTDQPHMGLVRAQQLPMKSDRTTSSSSLHSNAVSPP